MSEVPSRSRQLSRCGEIGKSTQDEGGHEDVEANLEDVERKDDREHLGVDSVHRPARVERKDRQADDPHAATNRDQSTHRRKGPACAGSGSPQYESRDENENPARHAAEENTDHIRVDQKYREQTSEEHHHGPSGDSHVEGRQVGGDVCGFILEIRGVRPWKREAHQGCRHRGEQADEARPLCRRQIVDSDRSGQLLMFVTEIAVMVHGTRSVAQGSRGGWAVSTLPGAHGARGARQGYTEFMPSDRSLSHLLIAGLALILAPLLRGQSEPDPSLVEVAAATLAETFNPASAETFNPASVRTAASVPRSAFKFTVPGELKLDQDAAGVVNIFESEGRRGYVSVMSLPDEGKLLGDVLFAFTMSKASEFREQGLNPRVGPVREATVEERPYFFRWLHTSLPDEGDWVYGAYVFLLPESTGTCQVMLMTCPRDEVSHWNATLRSVISTFRSSTGQKTTKSIQDDRMGSPGLSSAG